jgi:hypothetical protein
MCVEALTDESIVWIDESEAEHHDVVEVFDHGSREDLRAHAMFIRVRRQKLHEAADGIGHKLLVSDVAGIGRKSHRVGVAS